MEFKTSQTDLLANEFEHKNMYTLQKMRERPFCFIGFTCETERKPVPASLRNPRNDRIPPFKLPHQQRK